MQAILAQCNSCKKNVMNNLGAVQFPCPQCAKYTIVRCQQCREIVSQYTCPECSFTGPN